MQSRPDSPLERAKASAAFAAEQTKTQSTGDLCGHLGREVPEQSGGEIMSRIDVLYSRTEILSGKIARLNQRLRPVLIQVPDSPNENACAAGAATELGGLLSVLGGRLALLIDAVDTIDATLDL